MSNDYQVVMLSPTKLKPDPKQPRRRFDKVDIEELAESIRRTGLLKNIEADPLHTIITGELRWRAARIAGLKEVPVRILDIPRAERLSRQLHENIHVTPMGPYDIAEALKAMFPTAVGTEKIGRIVGKNSQWVRDHLKLLEMPKPIQRAIADGRVPITGIRSVARIDALEKDGHVKKGTTSALANKIAKKELTNRDSMDRVAQAIADNPGAAHQYVEQSYKGKDEWEVQATLDRIAPTYLTQKLNYDTAIEAMVKTARSLTKRLEEFPFEKLGTKRTGLLSDLKRLKEIMSEWHEKLK